MKPPPSDPYAMQELAMAALIADIHDPKATNFVRLDALRAVTKATRFHNINEDKNDGA